jgi:hypothetical protein
MNLDLMRLIDSQFLETPFYGVRQMTWQGRVGRCVRSDHPPKLSRWIRAMNPSRNLYNRATETLEKDYFNKL